MRVLSPVGQRPAVIGEQHRKAVRVSGEVIGIIDDGLSGAYLPHLAATLQQAAEPAKVVYWTKTNGGAPAPLSVIEQLARECDAVIVGVAL